MDRQSMIDKIYEVIKPTVFLEEWLSYKWIELVMIWDVLDNLRTMTEKKISIEYEWKIYRWELDPNDLMLHLMRNRKYLREPIEKQPDHLIEDVYKISISF